MAHLYKCFEFQCLNAKPSVIPFIKDKVNILLGARIMEIGSAEGGVLKAFIEIGGSY